MKKIKNYSNTLKCCFIVICFAVFTFNIQGVKANPIIVVKNEGPALSIMEQINKATKDGKAVFLLITGTGATGIDNAVKIAKEASGKLKKSVVVPMNRDDAANSAVVTKYRIASVPVPFILVISPKGVAVAGFENTKATADLLVKSIPSPKQDEVLFAVNEKRPVFIVVSKKGCSDKTEIIKNCKEVIAKSQTKPQLVEIDFNDEKEAAFLKQLGITSITTETTTIIANASGQVTETIKGAVTVEKLTASACKVLKSGGCCPGGSSKGCGPAK